MICLVLVAALAIAEPPPNPNPVAVQPLGEAAFAIKAGRLEQARLMIKNAVNAGVSGPEMERVMADFAYASGDYRSALARYLHLLAANPSDGRMFENAGIAAMKIGEREQAGRLLQRATDFPTATWRAWNAKGISADYDRDWTAADDAYSRAAALAPDRAEVWNNAGWSLLARGLWTDALQKIERAAVLDPKSARIAANLELARAAVTDDLPQRRPGESQEAWTARLNDAGVIAGLQGNNRKAAAAFTRAIQTRTEYYDRAANNLASVQAK